MTNEKPRSNSADELLTIRELATRLKCSVAAIRFWVRAGLPVHRLGKLLRFTLAEVMAWHEAQQSQKVAQAAA